jgi:hypothetical protein
MMTSPMIGIDVAESAGIELPYEWTWNSLMSSTIREPRSCCRPKTTCISKALPSARVV